MNKALSDAQYSAVVGLIARVPVEQARRLVLEKLQQSLPSKGRVAEAELAEAINSALASFTPGQWVLAEDGWRLRRDPRTLTLKEWGEAYPHVLRGEPATDSDKRCWPPLPTPEQRMAATDRAVAKAAEWEKNATPEQRQQAADSYELEFLCGGDEESFKRRKAERRAMSAAEIVFDPTQPPPAKPAVVEAPPAVPELPAVVEAEEEEPSPFFSDWVDETKDNRGRSTEQSTDMSPMAVAARMARRFKRGGGRGGNTPKAFF